MGPGSAQALRKRIAVGTVTKLGWLQSCPWGMEAGVDSLVSNMG